MPAKLFTLEEANRLVPELEPLLRRLVERRQALREHAQVIEEFRAAAGKSGGGMPGGRFGKARAAAETLGTEIAEGIRRIVPHLFRYASGEHEVIAYGLLLMLIMIFMPEGLVSGTADLLRRRRGRTGGRG